MYHIEKSIKNKRELKFTIFRTLLETRDKKDSIDHMSALKMIDDAFAGRKVLGMMFHSRKDKDVLEIWKGYSFFAQSIFKNGISSENKKIIEHLFDKLLKHIAISLSIDYKLINKEMTEKSSLKQEEGLKISDSQTGSNQSKIPESRMEPDILKEKKKKNDDDDYSDDSGWIETDVEI